MFCGNGIGHFGLGNKICSFQWGKDGYVPRKHLNLNRPVYNTIATSLMGDIFNNTPDGNNINRGDIANAVYTMATKLWQDGE